MSILRRCLPIAALLAACGPPRPSPSPLGSDPCHISGELPSVRDTLIIAYSTTENDALRVIGDSNRTLIRLDCLGQVRPDLALRWTSDQFGNVWIFDLDSTLPAPQVVHQWEARRNGGIWPWPRILAVKALTASRLEVTLDSVFSDLPTGFGYPELALTLPGARRSPLIRIQVHQPGVDERDLLDQAAGSQRAPDILITRNPDVISYAGGLPGHRVIPLPWDRTYVAVAPLTRPELSISDEEAFRASLARDVVRGEARSVDSILWIRRSLCPGTRPLRPMGQKPSVVYPRDDATGRELAERMIAVHRAQLRVEGLPPHAFSASLAGGEAAMYIVPLQLGRSGFCSAIPTWPESSWVLPLVDTRARVIVRPGVPPFSIDALGAIRISSDIASDP